jgi:hypothetical protein
LKSILSLLVFLMSLVSMPILADPTPDFYFTQYEITHFEFLRQYYYEVENGRMIQSEGSFSSFEWKKPFEYREKLKAVGLNVDRFNVLKFSIKEKDDVHYSFPLLLFPVETGDLGELNDLKPGERIAIYGKFFDFDKSEYAIVVHVIETVQKGGHDRDILLDARIPPTPTPTATVTPTPGPTLWDKVKNTVNPKEEPTGTVTPNAS